jgi:hypothetical protein
MGTRTKPVPWTDVPMVVETNAPDTHARESLKHPVGHRTSRAIERDHTWIFTDGSGSGWHAAVVLRPDRPVRLLARSLPREMSNVGAEMNGLILAIEVLEPAERATIVSDYLWDAHYLLGWRNLHKPALIRLVDQARALLSSRRPEFLRYIHTRGHRLDGTDFGVWNDVADKLCGARVAYDGELPEAHVRAHLKAQRPISQLLISPSESLPQPDEIQEMEGR